MTTDPLDVQDLVAAGGNVPWDDHVTVVYSGVPSAPPSLRPAPSTLYTSSITFP
jgi:hypothetical protein